MKKFLFKTVALVTFLVYSTTPTLVAAQSVISSFNLNPFSFFSSGGTQSADQRLQQTRQADQEKCELESSGSSALKKLQGLANPQSLQNILQKGLTEKLGESLNKIWKDKIPGIISQQISQKLPSLVKSGLEQRLPSWVNGELRSRASAGASASDLRSAFPEIISSGIKALLPQILGEVLNQLIPQALQTELPNTAATEIASAVPQIIQASTIPTQVSELVASTTNNFVTAANNAPESATNGIPSEVINIVGTNNPEIKVSQSEVDAATNTTVNGISNYAVQGIINSSGFSQLIKTLIQSLSEQIIPSLGNFTLSSYSSELASFSGGNWSNQSLDQIFNQGTGGILGDFSLDSDFLRPTFDSLGNSLTNATVNGIRDWQVANVLSGTFDQYGNAISVDRAIELQPDLANRLSAIPGVNDNNFRELYAQAQSNQFLQQNPGMSELRALDDARFLNGVDDMSYGGQTAVLNNSGVIGADAANKFSFSNLGSNLSTSLKSGLADGIGGMVGGLIANNVPFVGDLLGGIAQQYVTQALGQLLGVGGGSPIGITTAGITTAMPGDAGLPLDVSGSVGIATAVLGNTMATFFGFMASNMNTGQTAGNTKTLTKQGETLIKQDQQRNNVLQQACTYEKSSNRVMLSLEKLFFIQISDAIKANFRAAGELFNGPIRKMMSSGYQVVNPAVPGSQDGKNGQTLAANLGEDTAEAGREAREKTVAEKNASDNWTEKQVAPIMAKINQKKSQIPPGLSKQEAEELQDPAKRMALAKENPEKLWSNFLAFNTPGGNPNSSLLLAIGDQQSQELQAAHQAEAKYIANQGIRDIRLCTEKGAAFGGAIGDAFCATWKTLMPGSMFGSLFNRVAQLPLDFLTVPVNNVDAFKEETANQIAALTNAVENPATNRAVQQTRNVGNDPCPGPGPCQKTGWQGGQISTQAVEKIMDSSINNAFGQLGNLHGNSNDSANSGNGFDLGNLDFSNLEDLFPKVTIRSFALSEDRTTLTWETENAIGCTVENDWLGTGKKTGDFIADDGSGLSQIAVQLPETYQSFTYRLSCRGTDSNDKQSATINLPENI